METFDLLVQIHASAHLLYFQASSEHEKPFKIELEFFVPKICNNFTDTYDIALKLWWLTDMYKMNIHLQN